MQKVEENQDTLKRRSLPFTQIENAIIEDTELSIYAKQCYTVLCYHADNSSNTCFPSISTIAKLMSCSERKAQGAIKELIKYEYILKEARKREDNPNVNTSNLYTILVQYEYIRKKKSGGVVQEVHGGGAGGADKLYSLNNTSGEGKNPEGAVFEDEKESKNISRPVQEPVLPVFLSEETKEAIEKEISEKKGINEEPEMFNQAQEFLDTLDAPSRVNMLSVQAGSTKTITEMLEYLLDYENKTGREIKDVPAFIYCGLREDWKPGSYYRWGLDKLKALNSR